MSGHKQKKGIQLVARRAARGAAVQAVYQAMMARTALSRVVDEFLGDIVSRSHGGEENPEIASGFQTLIAVADQDFFRRLLQGLDADLSHINAQLMSVLPENRPLEQQLPLAVAILRCGIAEFRIFPQTPAAVIIDEYVEVASGFFSEREPAFINAILDQFSNILRPGETNIAHEANISREAK